MTEAPTPMVAIKTATRSFRWRELLPGRSPGADPGDGIIPEGLSSLARSSGDISSVDGGTACVTPGGGSSPDGGGTSLTSVLSRRSAPSVGADCPRSRSSSRSRAVAKSLLRKSWRAVCASGRGVPGRSRCSREHPTRQLRCPARKARSLAVRSLAAYLKSRSIFFISSRCFSSAPICPRANSSR